MRGSMRFFVVLAVTVVALGGLFLLLHRTPTTTFSGGPECIPSAGAPC